VNKDFLNSPVQTRSPEAHNVHSTHWPVSLIHQRCRDAEQSELVSNRLHSADTTTTPYQA